MFGASKLILLAFGAGYTCSLYFLTSMFEKGFVQQTTLFKN